MKNHLIERKNSATKLKLNFFPLYYYFHKLTRLDISKRKASFNPKRGKILFVLQEEFYLKKSKQKKNVF